MQSKTYTLTVGERELTATFTNLADQANGSVLVGYGDTTVLATATMSKDEQPSSYFPLSVEYEEKFYAAGQILGSQYMRREGRPSEEAVLSGRVIDRTLRPLFDGRTRHAVQIVITVLSIGEDDPDVLGVIAASLALGTSDIPWAGPVSAVRLGATKDTADFAINPTYSFRRGGEETLDLLVCGKDGLVNMIEAGAREIVEDIIERGLTEAQQTLTALNTFQEDIIKEIGKEKRVLDLPELSSDAGALFDKYIAPKLDEAIYTKQTKHTLGELTKEWLTLLEEHLPDEDEGIARDYLDRRIDERMHKRVLAEDTRPDGRALDEIRPLYAQAGEVAPMLHGAGIFYRGGTHILSALTLGGPGDSLVLDGMEVQDKKRYIHHYNFPPFSVGETGRIGGFNRRMIGHGALAERALVPVLPPKETFPYTVRIVSEVLASNGSSSMGSVCGSTLALMDAGVPISAPVAGIAMGLILGKDNTYKILTDIQGPEDHHGDMDLKVAGTRAGVTAMQMDVKVAGVSVAMLIEALAAARRARLQILDVIETAIPAPRPELPSHAPHIITLQIQKEHIGLVIGSGGKTITAIKELSGADIDIEEENGQGIVFITGANGSAEKAQSLIEELTHEYKVGERYEGVVTRIMDFGAFVRLNKDNGLDHDTEGLVHISELAPFRIARVTDVVAEGDVIPVVVKEIDERDRINLSLKDVDPDFAHRKGVTPAATPQNNGQRATTQTRQRPHHQHRSRTDRHSGNSR